MKEKKKSKKKDETKLPKPDKEITMSLAARKPPKVKK